MMVSVALNRPWCWLTHHSWGPMSKYVGPYPTERHWWCIRCGAHKKKVGD